MKIKKLMLLALPAVALTLGIVALNTPSNIDCSPADAANYTPSNRKITFNSDNSVTATFSVNDNVLDSRGWLLCLFSSKLSFDPVTHKINGSDQMHPYSTAECAHYFYAANTTKEGNISVTWNANFADQKESWSAAESTGASGHTLEDYLNQGTDWYIVVGIRHWNTSWATHGDYPGEGTDGQGNRGWWENTDYYAGRKSVIKGNFPYGEIYLDLTEFRSWEADNAKFGVYFFGGDKNAFSDFAKAVPLQDGIYIASYELNFQPTSMIGMRFNKDCTTPNDQQIWNQTQNLTFHQYGVIGVTDYSNGWSDALATVKITRGNQEIEVVLDNYKRNAESKSEHYNDYIDLQKNDEFVIEYKSSSYYSYDSLEIFDNNFSLDNTKIKVNVGGTYSFYFKAYENEQVHHDVFISKPEVAFADAWALSFLGGINGTCDKTKENWSTYEDEFDDLPHSAKEFLLSVEHESDPNVKFENYFAQAIQRYDYVIYLYGTSAYNDYIGRVEAGKFTPRTSNSLIDGVFSSESSTQITLVIIVSVASLTALSGCLILKKRKASN
ncbi:MAG: hypothetical protein IJQ40_01025 [Bacilli bacterium]|nr:hypothetical protein [Bacilli bacterium]